MVYKPDIPNPDDPPADQHTDIRENFSQLDIVDDVDHYKFSSTTPYIGMHKAVRFREQSSDPDTDSDQIALYAKDSDDGILSWYVRGRDDGPVIQITDGTNFNRPGLGAAVRFDFDGNILGTSNNVASVSRTNITPSGSVRFRFRYTVTFNNTLPEDCYVSLTEDLNGSKQNNLSVSVQTTSKIDLDVLQSIPAATPLFDGVECIVWRPAV